MAEIPVERKSSFPAWLWLLPLALLAGLLWWYLASDDGLDYRDGADAVVAEDTLDETPADGVLATDTADGALTDLGVIANTSDGSLEGRDVMLTGVTAGEVPDDAGFYVLTAAGEKVWVVLEEVQTPNTPIEGRVDVDEGDTIDIVGTIRNASDGAPAGAAIPGPTKPLPAGINHFIYASRVTQSGT